MIQWQSLIQFNVSVMCFVHYRNVSLQGGPSGTKYMLLIGCKIKIQRLELSENIFVYIQQLHFLVYKGKLLKHKTES